MNYPDLYREAVSRAISADRERDQLRAELDRVKAEWTQAIVARDRARESLKATVETARQGEAIRRARIEEAERLLGQCARGTNAHPFCPGCGKSREVAHGSWCPLAAFLAQSAGQGGADKLTDPGGQEGVAYVDAQPLTPSGSTNSPDHEARLNALERRQEAEMETLRDTMASVKALEGPRRYGDTRSTFAAPASQPTEPKGRHAFICDSPFAHRDMHSRCVCDVCGNPGEHPIHANPPKWAP